jgi:hypothetical protein
MVLSLTDVSAYYLGRYAGTASLSDTHASYSRSPETEARYPRRAAAAHSGCPGGGARVHQPDHLEQIDNGVPGVSFGTYATVLARDDWTAGRRGRSPARCPRLGDR